MVPHDSGQEGMRSGRPAFRAHVSVVCLFPFMGTVDQPDMVAEALAHDDTASEPQSEPDVDVAHTHTHRTPKSSKYASFPAKIACAVSN